MTDVLPRSATPEPRCPVIVTESAQCVLRMGHGHSTKERDCVPQWLAQLASSGGEIDRLRAALERITDLASRMYEDWPTIDIEIGRAIDEARAALSAPLRSAAADEPTCGEHRRA